MRTTLLAAMIVGLAAPALAQGTATDLADRFQMDVCGFGSDLTVNLMGGLDVPLGTSFKLGAGYRHMDVDYDEGQGSGRGIWKITYQGPYLFGAYTW